MENKEIKEKSSRGGKRQGAERPFRNSEKGKMNKHGITMHDEDWESIINKATDLNLSASQYLVMLHKQYIQNNNE